MVISPRGGGVIAAKHYCCRQLERVHPSRIVWKGKEKVGRPEEPGPDFLGAGEGLSADTTTLRLAFTGRPSGQVNKQVLVFNCAHLLRCPGACRSAPLHLLLSICLPRRLARSPLLSFPVQLFIYRPLVPSVCVWLLMDASGYSRAAGHIQGRAPGRRSAARSAAATPRRDTNPGCRSLSAPTFIHPHLTACNFKKLHTQQPDRDAAGQRRRAVQAQEGERVAVEEKAISCCSNPGSAAVCVCPRAASHLQQGISD